MVEVKLVSLFWLWVAAMMMAEMPVQKRRNDRFFHLKCEDVDGRGGGELNAKRLKGACGSAPPIPRERKDKIGERVAALQQLVSPYGKTDTASVLQEAGGYIKFLHEQLEVLSAPYLQAPSPSIGNSNVSPNPHSLRSRGLCLVPVAYSRQLTSSNGADIWAPNNTKSSKF